MKIRYGSLLLCLLVTGGIQTFAKTEKASKAAAPTAKTADAKAKAAEPNTTVEPVAEAPKSETQVVEPAFKPEPTTEAPVTNNENSAAEPPAKESKRGRIGGAISLAVPHLKEMGLEYITGNKFFSFGLYSGGFSLKPDSKLKLEISSLDLRGRWHPFAGSFFLGLGYGKQSISVAAEENIDVTTGATTTRVPTSVQLKVDSNYLLPHMGWFWVWDIGFSTGFELGMLKPSGVKSTLTSDAPDAAKATSEYTKLEKDAKDAGDKVGGASIPYLLLFKIGWVF